MNGSANDWDRVFTLLDMAKDPKGFEKRLSKLKAEEDAALENVRKQRESVQAVLNEAYRKREDAEKDAAGILKNAREKADALLVDLSVQKDRLDEFCRVERQKLQALREQIGNDQRDLSLRQAALREKEMEAARMKSSGEAMKEKYEAAVRRLEEAGVKV